MAQGFVTINGARLWYEDMGAPAGHVVTFVHAAVCDHRQWDTQVASFAERYRVIRFDMRGFGQSELPAGPFSLSDDIGGLLDALGVERSAVVACSMGGSAAIDFTLKQPERVSALALVGTGMGGGPEDIAPEEAQLIAQMEEAQKVGDVERLNDAEIRFWVDGLKRTPEQVAPGVRELMAEMNLANNRRADEWARTQSQRLDPPAAQRLGEIHTPTLVVVGGDDALAVRKAADLLEAGIAGARKVVMPGLTHVPNMERPAEFNQLVLDFLAPIW